MTITNTPREIITYTQEKQEAIKAIDHLLHTWTKDQYVRGQYYTQDGKMCAQEYIAHSLYTQGSLTIPSIMEIIRATLIEVSPFSNIMLLNDRTDHDCTKFYLKRVRDRLENDINITEGDKYMTEE